MHRHNRRRQRHQDNDDQDGGHRDDDGDVDEKNVQEKLCTGLHWALCTGRCALVCTGRVQQSSLFATCPEIQPVFKFHQIILVFKDYNQNHHHCFKGPETRPAF